MPQAGSVIGAMVTDQPFHWEQLGKQEEIPKSPVSRHGEGPRPGRGDQLCHRPPGHRWVPGRGRARVWEELRTRRSLPRRSGPPEPSAGAENRNGESRAENSRKAERSFLQPGQAADCRLEAGSTSSGSEPPKWKVLWNGALSPSHSL